MGAISKHADTKPIWNDVKIIFAEDGEVIKLKLMDVINLFILLISSIPEKNQN